MSYSVSWEQGGLYRKFSDMLTGRELFEAAQTTQGDARFDDLRFILNDFTEVNKYTVDLYDITKVAYIGKAATLSNPNIIVANVIKDDQSMTELAEQYCQLVRDGFKACLAFTALEPAWEWVLADN